MSSYRKLAGLQHAVSAESSCHRQDMGKRALLVQGGSDHLCCVQGVLLGNLSPAWSLVGRRLLLFSLRLQSKCPVGSTAWGLSSSQHPKPNTGSCGQPGGLPWCAKQVPNRSTVARRARDSAWSEAGMTRKMGPPHLMVCLFISCATTRALTSGFGKGGPDRDRV